MAKRTKRSKPGHPLSPTETFHGGLAISPGLRQEAARLQNDRDYERAREAILTLVKDGPYRTLLGERRVMPLGYVEPDLLTIYVCSAIRRPIAKKQAREMGAARFAGMGWKTLDSFPGRIEATASEIERINRGYLAPKTQPDSQSPEPRRAEGNFQELPGLMRVWANALRKRIQSFPFYHRKGALPIDWLQVIVNETTGGPHHKPLADLLCAAQVALGAHSSFDEVKLAQNWSRREPVRRIAHP